MTIRPAAASDLAAVRTLDAEVFGADAWSAAAWQGVWEQVAATRHLVVAVEAERVVGYAVLAAIADVADLHRIAVASEWRRQGLGGALVSVLLAEARARRCRLMLLEVEAGNGAALALYGRFGFVETARRDAYYGPGRDAVVMELGLG